MSRARPSAAFWVLVTGSLLYFTAQGMLFPVLPRYVRRELGGGSNSIGWVVAAFAFGGMVVRPWAGRAADLLGRRIVVASGSLLWAATVGLYALVADSLGVGGLIGIRAIGGLGSGALFVAMASIATDLAPPEQRVRWFAVFSSSTLVGFGLGPALVDPLFDGRRYGAVFAVVMALGTAPAWATLLLPDTRTTVAGAARAAVFHPAARRPGIGLLLGSMGFITFAAFVPDYADTIDFHRVGRALTLMSATNLVVRLGAGRLVDGFNRRALAAGSIAFVVASALTLALWRSPAGIYVAAMLNGTGSAYLYAGFLAMTVDRAGESQRAAAIGSLTVFSDLATSVGALVLGRVADEASYRAAFLASAGMATASFALTASGLLSSTPRRPSRRR